MIPPPTATDRSSTTPRFTERPTVPSYFTRLGERIEHEWRSLSYSEDRFPEISARALVEDTPIGTIEPDDVLRWVRTASCIVPQADVEARFGSPPVTVFRAPRFYITVLFWIDGTTSIHQHGFSGAFQVLQGSSIHVRYAFEPSRRVNPRMMLGSLDVSEVELLRTGDIRAIPAGSSFVHAHFHLDRPTTTIVIRTDEDPSCKPQWDYARPGLAVDPFFVEAHMFRKVQVASLMLSTQKHRALPAIEEIIRCSDLLTTYKVLGVAQHHLLRWTPSTAFGATIEADRFHDLLTLARDIHGEDVDLLHQCLTESSRQNALSARRGQIEDVDHRFLLAAVLNLPDRRAVLDLVDRRHPGSRPAELIADWTDALLNTRTSLGNVLGVPAVDHLGMTAFEGLVDGQPVAEIVARLRADAPDRSDAALEDIVTTARHLFGTSVLAPLVTT